MERKKNNRYVDAVRVLLEWLSVREKYDTNVSKETIAQAKQVLENLVPDIEHSALLERLASGTPPLEVPPPKSYGYPDYALIETGEGTYDDVHILGSDVIINDFFWTIVERRSDDEIVISYHDRGGEWLLTRDDTVGETWYLKKIQERAYESEHALG